METPVQLPSVPAGYERIGWLGFALALPEAWNLSLHGPVRGMTGRGLLVFSDLRGPAFEIRWQMPRRLRVLPADPQGALARARARLGHKGAVEAMGDSAFIVRPNAGKTGLALVAGRRHLYELQAPRAPESLPDITRDFLRCLDRLAQGPWLWSIYGLEAWLPPAAKLRQVSLKPGDCRLTFQLPPEAGAGPGTLTLAGFSLAQQILRDRSLRVWASAELSHVRDCPGGQWQESGHQATWSAHARRLGGVIELETDFRHDAANNRIHWTHTTRRCKN